MKNKVIWLGLSILIIVALLLTSCSSKSSTTKTAPSTTPTTTTVTAVNWWDKLGKPTYGGSMNLRLSFNLDGFDPYQGEAVQQIWTAWIEQLYSPDWTIDPKVQSYQSGFWDNSFARGGLLESWEFAGPGILILHVRHGIVWQNIPPANGRGFVASDIAFHFNRMVGLGDGYTKLAQGWTGSPWVTYITSVTPTDDYTLEMKWSIPNPEFILENFEAAGASTSIECPDAVKEWGDVTDWHHAIGTGPFMLTDFISGGSATLVKNPNYWGHDERYPQNKLPYIDSLNFLIMPDQATALSAMRTGKIDILDNLTTSQVQTMQGTNPEILSLGIPADATNTIDPRNDLKPFSDINVRKALQMSINLPEIASSYYKGTTSPNPSTLTSNYMAGWGFPYDQWPQALKDEYAFNVPAAKQLLTDAGYPTGFDTNIVVQNLVDMSLVQLVQSYFAAINVRMTINTMDPPSFQNYVVANHSNNALAMRSNGELGLGYAPMIQLYRFAPGNQANYTMVDNNVFTNALPSAMSATSTDQVKQILVDVNKEVAQQHFVISLIQANNYSLYQPWLHGYNAQYGSSWGWSGPQLVFFYESRFWIDQTLKNSLGH